ncbi:MAG TPA: TolC family protein, partial [Burkholderiaceae bacterium]|nr:TolC family protein [Burkholderiaceae bacterium]
MQPPEVAKPASYTPGPAVEQTAAAGDMHGGHAQRFITGQDIPAQWWMLFRSPALDGLVRQALESSPTMARASARLRQVQEERDALSGGSRLPRVDATLSANRIDVNPQSLGAQNLPFSTPFNLFLASVGVSYHFDLFGTTRNELQALQAEIDHQRYELEATRLMLAGNVVTAAIREASLREQIASSEQIIALQQRRLGIVERLEQLGTAAQGDVLAQRLELAQTRVLLPD